MLHHARGTIVHRQFRELAEEVSKELRLELSTDVAPPPQRSAAARPEEAGLMDGLKSAFLRGLRNR